MFLKILKEREGEERERSEGGIIHSHLFDFIDEFFTLQRICHRGSHNFIAMSEVFDLTELDLCLYQKCVF